MQKTTSIEVPIPAGFSRHELESVGLCAIQAYINRNMTTKKITKRLGFIGWEVFYEKVPADSRETVAHFIKWDLEILDNGLLKLSNPSEIMLISSMKRGRFHYLFDGEWTRASAAKVYKTLTK